MNTHTNTNTGLNGADQAYTTIINGGHDIVQLLTNEMVPVRETTIIQLIATIERIRRALPQLADWRDDNPTTSHPRCSPTMLPEPSPTPPGELRPTPPPHDLVPTGAEHAPASPHHC